MSADPAAPAVSIVIPVYNEEESLRPLWDATKPVLESLGRPWEVIFVDDGSTDRSWEILRALRDGEPRIRVLRLRRNSGETAAEEAGMRNARGEIVVTMDADLQNDPADIPALLEAIRDADMAAGWRRERHDPWIRRLSTAVARRFRWWFTRDGIHDSGCTFRAMRRRCLDRIKLYRNMHRFLPALFQMEGFRVVEVPVRHHPRRHGKSKYGIWNRLWVGIADTLAVWWMRKRRLDWEISERLE